MQAAVVFQSDEGGFAGEDVLVLRADDKVVDDWIVERPACRNLRSTRSLVTGALSAVTFQSFLGNDFPQMARNQVANLRDRRIRTVTYICQA